MMMDQGVTTIYSSFPAIVDWTWDILDHMRKYLRYPPPPLTFHPPPLSQRL
jgi:hypothetical protein